MESQGPDRRQLITLLVVSLLFAGGYMVYAAMTSPDPVEGPATEQAQPGVPDGAEERPAEPPDPRQLLAAEERIPFAGEEYVAAASNLNTGLTSFELTSERWVDEGETKDIVTTDKPPFYPLRMEVGGVDIPADAVWEVERVSENVLRFTWEGNGFRVVRQLEPGDGSYQLWSTVSVTNTSAGTRPVRLRMKTFHYVEREAEEGGFFAAQSPAISHGICAWNDEVERIDRELAVEGGARGHGMGPGVKLAGIESQYFANVMAVDGSPAERCIVRASDRGVPEPVGSLFEVTLVYPRADLAAGATETIRTLAYVGPKDPDALAAAGHGLKVVVDRGWFSSVAEWLVDLLGWIYGFVGNWGLAIILMTVLVRIVLFPLTWKSFQSMARMRVLKPEMDRINEMYKEDPQKKGAAIMEMYRKHKISPLGGCLPSLLQMPVWFAFYASLSTNTELYHANFALWYTDLSAPDPYFLLPITVGGLMFFQQKITPTAMDPTQAKIMLYFMPIMITSFLLFLPAGLCLYMVTNSVLGIAQQQWIHRSLDKKAKAAPPPGEGAKDGAGGGATAAGGEDEDDTEDEAVEDEEEPRSGSVVNVRRPKRAKTRKGAKRRTKRAR